MIKTKKREVLIIIMSIIFFLMVPTTEVAASMEVGKFGNSEAERFVNLQSVVKGEMVKPEFRLAEMVIIDNNQIPLATGTDESWSVLNFVLMISAFSVTVYFIVLRTKNDKKIKNLLLILPSAVGVVILFSTETFTGNMEILNPMTILFLIITVVQFSVVYLHGNKVKTWKKITSQIKG